MVSLYSHETDTDPSRFVASGLFIAPGVVLTAAHVFDGRSERDLWVRAQVDGARAVPIHGKPNRHPDLDAAWFRLEVHPQTARILELDLCDTQVCAAGYRLFGYLRGDPRFDDEPLREVRDFDASGRFYLVSPAHTSGQSGGALCWGPRVWALVSAVIDDLSAPEGVVLAMHQLWDGFLEQVERIGVVRERTAAGGSRTATAREGSTPATESPEQREAAVALRRQLKKVFGRPPLVGFDGAGVLASDGFPRALEDALNLEPTHRGKALVFFLSDKLVPALLRGIDDGDLVLDRLAALRLRRDLGECMGLACKLCVDPAGFPIGRTPGERRVLPVRTVVGVAILLRPAPLGALRPVAGSPNNEVFDPYVTSPGLECGEGRDLRQGLLEAVASLPSTKNPTGLAISLRSAAQFDDWKGFFLDERDKHRGRFLV